LKPYKIEEKDIKNLAEVKFENFKLIEIDQNGSKSTIFGKIGEKYKDRLVIYYPKYKKVHPPKEELEAYKGIYKNRKIYLYDNIVYKTKDFIFYAKEAIYDLKNEILKSKRDFRLVTKSATITGEDLIYYRNKGKILAKNIYANIITKNEK